MTKIACLNRIKVNTRPDRVYVVALGRYLREQRIGINVKSVAELVEMIDKMIALPPGERRGAPMEILV